MKKNKCGIIIRFLLIAIGSFWFFDALFLIMFSNVHIGHFITLVAGAALSLFGSILKRLPRFAVLMLCAFVLTFIFCVLFFSIYGSQDNTTHTEDAVIILGAGISKTELSENLKRRLDTAVEYYNKNPDTVFVVSGGQGPQEDISEAEAMALYLIKHGIPKEKILREDAASSTTENFAFSKTILDKHFECEYTTAFITNDYHIFRASIIAKETGLKSITHIHASTAWYTLVPNTVRETMATLKTILL